MRRPARLEERPPLRLGALARAEEREAEQVEPRAARCPGCTTESRISTRAPGRGVRADRPEDRGRLLVGPVVEDGAEDVGVAGRDALEEAARHECRSRRRRGPPRRGPSREGRGRSRAARVAVRRARAGASRSRRRRRRPSRPRATPGRRAGRPAAPSVLHRQVEQRPLARDGRRAIPRSRPRTAFARRRVEVPDRPVPDAAEELRERVPRRGPAGAARTPRCSRRRPARPPRRRRRSRARGGSRLSVSASAPTSPAISATGRGPRGERVGDAELGDDPRRSRRGRAAERVPEDGLAHPSARGRPRRRPRRARRRRACGSRAAASRRGRRRRPAARRVRRGSASSSSTAQAKLGSSASGSAPPPTRATVSSTVPPVERGEPLGAGANGLGRPRGSSAAPGRRRRRGTAQRPLERGERQLVGPERALERVAAEPLDELGAADDDARPAGRRAACRRRSRRGRRRRRASRATVGSSCSGTSTPEPRSSTSGSPCRAATSASSAVDGLLGEADDAEVRLVDAQEQRGVRPDRALVVGGARAVRRPDLDEAGAGAGEHVGDAEAVADLDQLAARDEHLAPLGERGEREQHRGGVVVDDERGLGAGQPAEDRRRRGPGASRARRRSRSNSRFE